MAASGSPVLSVDGFEGPLDWLLELARRQEIDLAGLSITALVEAFAAALEAALLIGERAVELGRWGDWLVLAATLAWLRSRLLLPAGDAQAQAAGDEAEMLRHRLLARAQMNAAGAWLARRPQLGHQCFTRGHPDRGREARSGKITDLLRACLAALRMPENQQAIRPQPPRLWRVADAVARITHLLDTLPPGSRLATFLPSIDDDPPRELRCRAAVASTLVAGLELARTGSLTLSQHDAWTPLEVGRGAR